MSTRPGTRGQPGAAGESAAPGEPGAALAASVPPPPAGAAEVFGSALPLAERYAAMLAGDGVVRGLIGPREADRLWDRHLLNCAVITELIPRPSTVLDIGSGAGLPGLVLAMLMTDVHVILVEPMARRVAFLDECVTALSLPNVTISRARAEEAHGHLTADVVTARAVAPLDRLAGMATPLVRPGGLILALKGERAATEAEAAAHVLRRLHISEVSVLQLGVGVIVPPATVVKMRVAGSESSRSLATPPRM